MKPSLRTIIAIILSIGSIHALAYDIAVENEDGVTIYYNYVDTTLSVAYHSSYHGKIVIPSEVTYKNRKKKVTSIGGRAFKYCKITSVTIPNSVTTIRGEAFYNCKNLQSVEIPNSVTYIGGGAFRGCSSLTSINIPSSVSQIGGMAFFSSSVKAVYITDLESYNKILTNVHYEDEDYKNHSRNPFYRRFYRLYLNGVELNDLTIPNGIEAIRDYLFSSCTSLTSVSIPNSVTSIGVDAFEDCSNLKSVAIPNNVTSIGSGAFSGCSGLTSLTIPNSVTSIGGSAFWGCSGLTSFTIPNSVSSIEVQTFRYCSNLESVYIPNSVTSIKQYAFSDCNSITTIISNVENPSYIEENTFERDVYYNATLYVPKGTIDKYKSRYAWYKFVFIEEGIPNGIQRIEMEKPIEKQIYMPNGTKIGKPQKGLNIIKYDDGEMKKVFIK